MTTSTSDQTSTIYQTSTSGETSTARSVTLRTPVGPFTVIASDIDTHTDTDTDTAPMVLASGWTAETAELLPLIATDLRPTVVHPVDRIDGVSDAVLAYHDGDVHAVDAVPVRQHSGPFLQHAWDVLRQVAPGSPITYTEFAARAGRPAAIRAAGSACARNAAALFVPCHRVVPTAGGVGSFRWGPSVKDWLLERERTAEQ